MAMRLASRYVPRRFSSSGKILSEEEKAAENVYIKKIEKEKLEKLAQKAHTSEAPTATTGAPLADAKPSVSASSGTEKVSTDKTRNYAVVAGTLTALAALGWYLKGKPKKEEIQD